MSKADEDAIQFVWELTLLSWLHALFLWYGPTASLEITYILDWLLGMFKIYHQTPAEDFKDNNRYGPKKVIIFSWAFINYKFPVIIQEIDSAHMKASILKQMPIRPIIIIIIIIIIISWF